jgi:lipoate-protein ligase A
VNNVDPLHVARRLPYSVERADLQLAAGSALLAGLEQDARPALRWYGFSSPALLLGPSQQPAIIDAATCAQANLTIHRRRSGGGIVLGDETLLMLDLTLPRGHPLYMHSVTESYRWIGEVWVATLCDLGLAARTVSIAEARADSQTLSPLLRQVCFGSLSPYEVAVGQRKTVGLAQMRRRGGALFQCAVHLRWEPHETAMLMAATASEQLALARQLSERVGGLADLLGHSVDSQAVMSSFETALSQLAGLTLIDTEWNTLEQTARSADLERFAAIVH